MVKLTVSLEEEFATQIRDVADKEGRTISGLVKFAVEKYFNSTRNK